MNKILITLFAIIAITQAQSFVGTSKYGAQQSTCQQSIIDLSNHIDLLKKDLLTPEQYRTQLPEITNSFFEECREDIEKMIQNPSGSLPELIKNVSSNPELISKLPPIIEAIYRNTVLYLAGFLFLADLDADFPDYKECFASNYQILQAIEDISDDIEGGTVRDYLEALQELLPLYDGIIASSKSCPLANQAAKERIENFIQDLHSWDYVRRLTISFLEYYPDLSEDFYYSIEGVIEGIKEDEPLLVAFGGILGGAFVNQLAAMFANIQA